MWRIENLLILAEGEANTLLSQTSFSSGCFLGVLISQPHETTIKCDLNIGMLNMWSFIHSQCFWLRAGASLSGWSICGILYPQNSKSNLSETENLSLSLMAYFLHRCLQIIRPVMSCMYFNVHCGSLYCIQWSVFTIHAHYKFRSWTEFAAMLMFFFGWCLRCREETRSNAFSFLSCERCRAHEDIARWKR